MPTRGNTKIFLSLSLGFAVVGVLTAYFFGHSQSKFFYFALPNFLSASIAGAAIQGSFGKNLVTTIATPIICVFLYLVLLLLGLNISINRKAKLLSINTSIVTGSIIDNRSCYKSCKWVATYKYSYNGEDYTDEIISNDREPRLGQRVTILISQTNPNVAQILHFN